MLKMKKVYIWGAGQCFDIVYESVNRELCVIVGVIDTNQSKQGKTIGDGLTVVSPNVLLDVAFDYILISVRDYEQIVEKCRKMKIDDEKIIAFWNPGCRSPYIDCTKTVWNLKRMLDIYKYRWENLPYELGMGEFPIVRSSDALLDMIFERKVSLCRFSDGEFEMMRRNYRLWYQKVNEELASRLYEILHSDCQNVVIAVANVFGSLENYTEEAADGIRKYLGNGTRNEVIKLLDLKCTYYDAYVSRPYMIYRDKSHAEKIFRLMKKIWRSRDLLIVEGEYSRMGVGSDLFAGVKRVRRILCPHENAFDKYNEIFGVVEESVLKDELVLISLGPAATVLAYDLAQQGIQALDIGQIDNEYEWYLRKVSERVEIPGKVVAELSWCHEPESIFEICDYESQIIARIR